LYELMEASESFFFFKKIYIYLFLFYKGKLFYRKKK
jgi:hypothetical protein